MNGRRQAATAEPETVKPAAAAAAKRKTPAAAKTDAEEPSRKSARHAAPQEDTVSSSLSASMHFSLLKFVRPHIIHY